MKAMPSRLDLSNHSWLASFFLMLALLLINGIISYHAIRMLINNESRIYTTLNTLNILKDTFSAVQDAETGQRGFLLSDNSAYLEPYHSAIEKISVHLNKLQRLSSSLATPRPRITTLTELIQEKLVEMERTVQLRTHGDKKEALDKFLSNEGNMLMRQIRSLVGELQQNEYDKLAQQRKQARKVQQQVIVTLVFATLLALILAALVYVLVGRVLQKQLEDAEKLALTNEELEAIVTDRTMALERYAVELQRSNRELQDFAFVASHDLQEPLRKIRSFGDRLVQKHGEQLGEGSDYIERMQSAATRMSRLIEDLLTFSRITSQAKKFEQVSLQEILNDVLEDLDVVIENRGANIEADPLPTLQADPTQMRQLLQNLLGNAIKFVPMNRSPLIHIQTHIFIPDDQLNETSWVEIHITDNGIGFDEQFLDRIFTPFQRLHGKSEYPGTGIGLSICRRIVEHHHGTIKAHSSPDQGATFIVRLPLQQENNTQFYTNTGTHHASR